MIDKTVETKYSLESPSYLCADCSREIERGSAYYSAIRFAEGAFERRESCSDCWSETAGEDEAVYAFWRTRRPEPREEPPRRRRFDIELIWTFFLNLEEDLRPATAEEIEVPEEGESGNEAASGADADASAEREGSTDSGPGGQDSLTSREKSRLLFFLALLLLRGKRLVLERSLYRDGREYLILSERRHRETLHCVEDPHLGQQDLEQIKGALGDLLQMDI